MANMLGHWGAGKYPVVLVTDDDGSELVVYAGCFGGHIYGSVEGKAEVMEGSLVSWYFSTGDGELVRVEDAPFCLARLPYPGRPYSLVVAVEGEAELSQWISLDGCGHWEPWARYRQRLIEGNGQLPGQQSE